MPEGQPRQEVELNKPLAEAVREVFERRARVGERKIILELYQQKFEQLITTLPKEKRDTMMVKIQKEMVKIGGYFREYSARFVDFMRNIFVWPMIAATEDFPKDKYYQIELARAHAWGEFGMKTTKTATAERNAYRDHFLSTAVVGAESVGVMGAFIGATTAGVVKGTLVGAAGGGLMGAGIGAVAGGVIGGVGALTLRYIDKMWGPPVAYYDLNKIFQQPGGVTIGSSGNSR